MTDQPKHSPLPWALDGATIVVAMTKKEWRSYHLSLSTFGPRDEAELAQREKADAAYIVQACNAFPQLKSAIQSMLTAIAAARSGDYAAKNWFEAAEQELLAAMEAAK